MVLIHSGFKSCYTAWLIDNKERKMKGKNEFLQPIEKKPSALRKFGNFLLNLPGTLLSGLFDIVVLIPKLVTYVLVGLGNFVEKYKTAISIACWSALGVAVLFGIAALVMALAFPGTWAAIAGTSVFGLTLAAIAGESVALQAVLACTFVFVAADLVFTPFFLLVAAIKNCCCPSVEEFEEVENNAKPSVNTSHGTMNNKGLSANSTPNRNISSAVMESAHSTNPFDANNHLKVNIHEDVSDKSLGNW